MTLTFGRREASNPSHNLTEDLPDVPACVYDDDR